MMAGRWRLPAGQSKSNAQLRYLWFVAISHLPVTLLVPIRRGLSHSLAWAESMTSFVALPELVHRLAPCRTRDLSDPVERAAAGLIGATGRRIALPESGQL
jgi:hypothetical protein